MRSPLASRAASGFRPAALGILILPLLAGGLAGCKTIDEPGAHVAGWTLIDPSQRHPIMVSQKPANLTIRVARGSHGLSPAQRAQVTGFLQHYRGTAMGNSRLVIAVPGGCRSKRTMGGGPGERSNSAGRTRPRGRWVGCRPRTPNRPVRAPKERELCRPTMRRTSATSC